MSLSPVVTSPYSLMAGLGVNGTAGVKGTAATADWPQILSGYGGPVADRPHQQHQLVRQQPAGSRHLSVLANRALHAGRISAQARWSPMPMWAATATPCRLRRRFWSTRSTTRSC